MTRTSFFVLAVAGGMALLTSGCAKPTKKLGQGITDVTEFARLGEIQRSMEQTALFQSPQQAYTTGFLMGFNKSLLRTGRGVFEIVTFPFPPYTPIFTNTLPVTPAWPDSYKPGMISDSFMDTDTYSGFSGGDVAPMIPGSRFKVFDN